MVIIKYLISIIFIGFVVVFEWKLFFIVYDRLFNENRHNK